MVSQLNTMNRCGTSSARSRFLRKEQKEENDTNINSRTRSGGISERSKWKPLHWSKQNESMNGSFREDLYDTKEEPNLKKKKISEIINKYKKSIQKRLYLGPSEGVYSNEFSEEPNYKQEESTKCKNEESFKKHEKEIFNTRKEFSNSSNPMVRYNERRKENNLDISSLDQRNCVECKQKEYINVRSDSLHNKCLHVNKESRVVVGKPSKHNNVSENQKENDIQIVKKEIKNKEPVIVMNWKEKECTQKENNDTRSTVMIDQLRNKYLGRKRKMESGEEEIHDMMYLELQKNNRLNDTNLSLYEKKQIYLDYEREKQIDFKKSLILKNSNEDVSEVSKDAYEKHGITNDVRDSFDVDLKKTMFNDHIYFDENRIREAFKEIELMEQSIRTKNLLSNKKDSKEYNLVQENIISMNDTEQRIDINPMKEYELDRNKIKTNVEHSEYNKKKEGTNFGMNEKKNPKESKDIKSNEEIKHKNRKPLNDQDRIEIDVEEDEEPVKLEGIHTEPHSYATHKNKNITVIENEEEKIIRSRLNESQTTSVCKNKSEDSLSRKMDPIKSIHPKEKIVKPQPENDHNELLNSLEFRVKKGKEENEIPWKKAMIKKSKEVNKIVIPRRNFSEQIKRTNHERGPVQIKHVSENIKYSVRKYDDVCEQEKDANLTNRNKVKDKVEEEEDVLQTPVEIIKKEVYSKDYFKKKCEEMEKLKRGLEKKLLASTLGHSIAGNRKNLLFESYKDTLSMFDNEEEIGERNISHRPNKRVDTLQSINLHKSKKEEPVKNRFEQIDHFNRILLERKLSQSWNEWKDGEKTEQTIQKEKKEHSKEKIKETLEILKENGLEPKNVKMFDEKDIQSEIKKKRKMYEIKIRKDFEERIKMRKKEHEQEPVEEETKIRKELNKKPTLLRKNKKDFFEEFSSDGSYYKRVYRDLYEDQCTKKMKSHFYDVSDNLYLQDCSDHFFTSTHRSSTNYIREQSRPSVNLDSESVSLSKIKFDDFDYDYLNRLNDIRDPKSEGSICTVESGSEQKRKKSPLVYLSQKPEVVFSENESNQNNMELEKDKALQNSIRKSLLSKEISIRKDDDEKLRNLDKDNLHNLVHEKEHDNILCKLIQRKITEGKREKKEENGIIENEKEKKVDICDVENSHIEKAKSNLFHLENVISQMPKKKRNNIMKDEENIEPTKTETVNSVKNDKKEQIRKRENKNSMVSNEIKTKQTVEKHKSDHSMFEKTKSNEKGVQPSMKNIELIDKNIEEETNNVNEKAPSIVSSSDLTLPKINILKDQENYIPLDIALNLVMDNQNLKKTIQKDHKKGTTKKKTFVQWLMDERKRRLKNNLPIDI